MNKAGNTYWTSSQAVTLRNRRAANSKKAGSAKAAIRLTTKSQWYAFSIAGFLTLMLCLTINFRAFSELNKEWTQNSQLENQIQAMSSENLALQEEIHYLKHDPDTVEREAKKFGLQRSKDKVSVLADK